MRIFILEDHPMVLNLYRKTLYEKFAEDIESIIEAVNCESAYNAIINDVSNLYFDIAILDYRIPPYGAQGLNSGLDVAKLIRKHQPKCKIIIITSTSEIIPVYDIFKKVNPEGIALKSDVDNENFIDMVSNVYNGDLYQSPTVKQFISQIWKIEIIADEANRQILFYMVKGHKIKDLHKVVPLSISSIRRRIADIKKAFHINDESSLIKEVISQGFL